MASDAKPAFRTGDTARVQGRKARPDDTADMFPNEIAEMCSANGGCEQVPVWRTSGEGTCACCHWPEQQWCNNHGRVLCDALAISAIRVACGYCGKRLTLKTIEAFSFDPVAHKAALLRRAFDTKSGQ